MLDDDTYDFAQTLDDQLCVPCILCNCQGCGVCIAYGAWTPGDQDCACESGMTAATPTSDTEAANG